MFYQNRRRFLKTAGLLTAGALSGYNNLLAQDAAPPNLPSVVFVKGGTQRERVRTAVEMLGGITRFVKKGYTVVVKPNIGWDRSPEQAADTDPEVVAGIVEICREAGADRVLVFDRPCNKAERCYENSGIREAAEKAGAMVSYVVNAGYKDYAMPGNKYLKKWPLYTLAMEADCLINVPIAKHHNISELTLGMKNLMGIMGGNRGQIHWKIHQYLPELAAFVKPALTIVDATRILVANGPQGGSLSDVERRNMLIAGTAIGSVDAYAATLFGKKPDEIGYIVNSPAYGLGEIEIEKMNRLERKI